MDEYIEREKVLSKAAPLAGCFSYMISAYDVIMIPAADVAPVRHGRWVKSKDELCTIKCSTCREEWYFECDDDVFDLNYHYCPNCGAKMDLEG